MKMSKTSRLTCGLWLPIALVATILSVFAYCAMWQNYRLTANDPQIQMSQEAIKDLSQVEDLAQLEGSLGKIDISQTLNPFIVVYDESGKPVIGNGYLEDKLPELPANNFAEAKKQADHRFTWEPNKDLSFAAVLKSYTGKQNGFILVGRSLQEVENRQQMLLVSAAIAWALSLLGSLLLSWFVSKYIVKHFSSHDHTHETHHHTA